MRDDRRVPSFPRHLNRCHGFAQGADLIHLNQDGIAHAFGDTPRKDGRIGYKQIITDQLTLIA